MRRPSPTIADHGPNSLKMCICVTNIHIELTPLNGLVPVTARAASIVHSLPMGGNRAEDPLHDVQHGKTEGLEPIRLNFKSRAQFT